TGLALDGTPIGVLQPHEGLRGPMAVGSSLEIQQAPRAAGRSFRAQHQCLDVTVEQFLLLVGERLEFLEDAVELRIIELEAQLLHTIPEGVTAAVLAQNQMAARQPDILGPENLVSGMVLEHPVLMDARFMSERILANDRFVTRNRHSGDAGN